MASSSSNSSGSSGSGTDVNGCVSSPSHASVNGNGALDDFETSLSLLEEVAAQGTSLDPVILTRLLTAFSRRRPDLLPRLTTSVLEHVGCELDPIAIASLIDAMGRMHSVQHLSAILRRVPPDVGIFNAALLAYKRAGMPGRARHLFTRLPRYHITPDVLTYNTVLDIMAEEGDLQEVHALLTQMQEAGVGFTTATVNILLKMHCRRGELDRCEALFHVMAGTTAPDLVTYHTMLRAYCEAGQLGDAERLLNSMEAAGLSLDHALNVLLLQHCRLRNAEAAHQLLQRMLRCGAVLTSDVFDPMLMASVRSMATEQVQEWLQLAKCFDFRLGVPTQQMVFNVMVQRGHLNDAEQILVAMDDGALRSASGWRALLRAYARAGRWPDVGRLLRRTEGLVPAPEKLTMALYDHLSPTVVRGCPPPAPEITTPLDSVHRSSLLGSLYQRLRARAFHSAEALLSPAPGSAWDKGGPGGPDTKVQRVEMADLVERLEMRGGARALSTPLVDSYRCVVKSARQGDVGGPGDASSTTPPTTTGRLLANLYPGPLPAATRADRGAIPPPVPPVGLSAEHKARRGRHRRKPPPGPEDDDSHGRGNNGGGGGGGAGWPPNSDPQQVLQAMLVADMQRGLYMSVALLVGTVISTAYEAWIG